MKPFSFLLFGLLVTGCAKEEPAFKYSFKVPEPQQLQFTAELTKRYGVALEQEIEIPGVGIISVQPESEEHGLRFGFRLDASALGADRWVGMREVQWLPNGTFFPALMKPPLVEVVFPEADLDPVRWRFYFVGQDQASVGVAGLVTAIDENFPDVSVSYVFRDAKKRPIIGLTLFGPWVDSNGYLRASGGLFIGTNLKPLLPGAGALAGPATQRAQTLSAEMTVSGRDARVYRDSPARLGRLLTQFLSALPQRTR